ncbi:MAG: acyl-CoA dehydrogenase family protein [Sphingomonadaceae bacterium]|nr:acyl-CoA dehydrogenase family protein [Sphingomonadaceae bacterium]
MNFELDPALEAFRQEVRAAIDADLTLELKAGMQAYAGSQAEPDDALTWMRILNKRGWSVPHWPIEYGGTGWSAMQLYIFNEECCNAWAPDTCWGETQMCGPVIYTFGSDYLKEKFLPAFRRGDYYLAQGFSEPGNGSDLARLRTAARREGNIYIVNGQKIWTSSAYASKWGFFLVRTDPNVKSQAGISFLMIKLDTPGITIRRIPQLNGEADLCEVFLDNVVVPAENLIGEEGKGWTYAKFLLDHERTTSSFIFFNKRELARAKMIAQNEAQDGEPLIRNPHFRSRLLRIEAELTALEWSVLRELSHEDFKYDATAAASTLKIAGSRLQQSINELQMDMLGAKAMRAFPFDPADREDAPLWPGYAETATSRALVMRAATIYGGTLQIQKGIIAKLAFDL